MSIRRHFLYLDHHVNRITCKGIFSTWWSVLGSLMRSSLGSRKATWIWLVNAPGVYLSTMELQPTYLNQTFSILHSKEFIRSLHYFQSPCKLENSPLSLGPVGNHKHIQGVLNSCDGSGSQLELLPSLPQVDDVDTILPLLEDVLLHRGLAVVKFRCAW